MISCGQSILGGRDHSDETDGGYDRYYCKYRTTYRKITVKLSIFCIHYGETFRWNDVVVLH